MSVWLCAATGYASVLGTVRGIVHDPQHRPIQGASVLVNAQASDWHTTAVSDQDGEFRITAVPAGRYLVTVSSDSFSTLKQKIEVQSGSAPVLHFALRLAAPNETVEVSAAPEWIDPASSATENLVSRDDIAKTPGADRAQSLAMITNFTPGATVIHDQLHVRGGHQVSWLVDGVPVPNTNIAGNVGPQFDPQDIDYVETFRGGYSAEYGDRMYGVFNLVPRSGFERNNEAELSVSYGSYNETNDHFSLGGHSERFAYYASLMGNRTDLGLQTPTADVIDGLSSSIGGFASLIYNRDHANQFRLVSSIRRDMFHIPNTPDQQDERIRDVQRESDAFLNFSWVRKFRSGAVLTVSPFLHRNHAAFEGGPGDKPIAADDDHTSDYAGGEASLSVSNRKHNLRAGFLAFEQRERALLDVRSSDGSIPALRRSETIQGDLETAYAEDQYRINSWFTFNGGIRLTHFAASLTENAASPRLGASLRVPRLNWVIRGYYGRYFQAPPLTTVSGPILDLVLQQGFGFLPLRGERDEQREFGLAIPVRGWAIDLSYFHTNARNFFDHSPLGNANIFIPLTIEAARIRGWEATARSPRILRRGDFHLVYSHQYAEGIGGITGGLTDFSPPAAGFFYLDHDQRDTFAAGFEADLPGHTWLTGNLGIGSGFLDGDGPAHLPGHATFDLSIGKSFGERFSLRLTTLNVGNNRYLLDNSNTFGGTHFNYPRQILLTLRYRFKY
jgi:outer membrane receptor protein involved in Fe transport